MNLILAWVLLMIGFSIGMAPIISPSEQIPGKRLSTDVIIADFADNSPAKVAGLVPGDVVKEVNAGNSDVIVHQFSDLTNFTDSHSGQTITITYVRSGETKKQDVTLLNTTEAPLGVAIIERSVIRVPLYDSPYIAAREEYRVGAFTFEFLGSYIHTLFATGKAGEGVGGPVAIYTYTGMFIKMGILALLQFVAMLSINLAIINILPIPALDGGRILFIIIEAIARKKIIKEKVENIIHTVGFAFLLLLIALITYGDIVKLIRK
jgi:regulator of sigma E protease